MLLFLRIYTASKVKLILNIFFGDGFQVCFYSKEQIIGNILLPK